MSALLRGTGPFVPAVAATGNQSVAQNIRHANLVATTTRLEDEDYDYSPNSNPGYRSVADGERLRLDYPRNYGHVSG